MPGRPATPAARRALCGGVSGPPLRPFLDRIDLHWKCPPSPPPIGAPRAAGGSAEVGARVAAARAVQAERYAALGRPKCAPMRRRAARFWTSWPPRTLRGSPCCGMRQTPCACPRAAITAFSRWHARWPISTAPRASPAAIWRKPSPIGHWRIARRWRPDALSCGGLERGTGVGAATLLSSCIFFTPGDTHSRQNDLGSVLLRGAGRCGRAGGIGVHACMGDRAPQADQAQADRRECRRKQTADRPPPVRRETPMIYEIAQITVRKARKRPSRRA